MKILLLYPESPTTFWSMKHALKLVNKKAGLPPLGLLTIATLLSEHELRLIDMNVNKLSDKDILWADYVFLSGMINQIKSVREIITRCKNLGIKVVAGGPIFNNIWEEFSDVTHFILSEAEITLPQFLDDLKAGNPKQVYYSEDKPLPEQIPLPRWDLVDMKNYARMPIQITRGCPFDCEFCDIVSLNGRKPRSKNVEQVIKEFNTLYDHGWRNQIFIVDDNFIGNKNLTKDILKALIKWRKSCNYPGSFTTQVSINLADDDELLELMKQSGFNTVFIGLETPTAEGLKECGKIQNQNRDMVAAVKKILSYGMEVFGGFILGFDSDDETIFERQLEFIQKTGIVVANISLLNAIPKTKLYNRLKQENRILNNPSGDFMDFTINFKPKMNSDILMHGYTDLVRTLYSAQSYYDRIFNFLEAYRHNYNSRLNINHVIAYFKATYTLGILDKNRKYYWKLFFTALFKYPKSFSKAIVQAGYYYHFNKVFKSAFEC